MQPPLFDTAPDPAEQLLQSPDSTNTLLYLLVGQNKLRALQCACKKLQMEVANYIQKAIECNQQSKPMPAPLHTNLLCYAVCVKVSAHCDSSCVYAALYIEYRPCDSLEPSHHPQTRLKFFDLEPCSLEDVDDLQAPAPQLDFGRTLLSAMRTIVRPILCANALLL